MNLLQIEVIFQLKMIRNKNILFTRWKDNYDINLREMFKNYCKMLDETGILCFDFCHKPYFYQQFCRMLFNSSSGIII